MLGGTKGLCPRTPNLHFQDHPLGPSQGKAVPLRPWGTGVGPDHPVKHGRHCSESTGLRVAPNLSAPRCPHLHAELTTAPGLRGRFTAWTVLHRGVLGLL